MNKDAKTKGHVFEENGRIYLVICPECGRENYAHSVASGVCAWCGMKANISTKKHQ